MKRIVNTVAAVLLMMGAHSSVAETKISEIEFTQAGMQDVIRTLSELSNKNIVLTPDASKAQVTIHLKNVTVEQAIKSISRISDMWYRFDDDTQTYRLMTREEYSKDLIVRDSEHIEVFKLLNANVRIVAQSIEDLFGSRVILSLGVDPGNQTNNSGSSSGRLGVRNSRSTTQSSRNNRNSNNANGFSGGSVSGGNLVNAGAQLNASQLTQAQIEQLSLRQTDQTIDSETLHAVTVQAQPIYVTVNNEHNMIVVRTDDKKVIQAIEKLVKDMDIPIPQVMLEMKILSVILGEDFNSIFNFQVSPSGSNQSSTLLGNNALLGNGSLVYQFLNSRIRGNIEFLEKNNRVKVLSNPMVLASNHREAELFIGEESLLTRGFTYNPPVITNNTVVSPAFVETETELEEIGITLRITPRINADSTVTLELEQENSTLNPGGATVPVSDGTGNVVNLPVDTVNNSRLTGTVLAKDGLTVAVGGLIRSSKSLNEQKVPLLAEIPLIGKVFRSTIETEEETETVLLITPHIITRPENSVSLQESENAFYQSYTQGYPDPQLPPNKIISTTNATLSESVLSPEGNASWFEKEYDLRNRPNSKRPMFR
jgi:general secretion pathway protein D